MLSRAVKEMTAVEVGLLAVGLVMINPKKFFDEMKPQMTGKEIEDLLLKQVGEIKDENCAFGKKWLYVFTIIYNIVIVI